MATKSPSQFHDSWPAVATTSDLPNVSGSSTQDSALEVGDTTVVLSGGFIYVCNDATLGSAVWSRSVGILTTSNKNMTASATVSDEDQATAVAIAATPAYDSYVQVLVNGVQVIVGDGIKVSPAECYFSGDGGTTPRSVADIVSGDILYWIGSVAGFQLAATDKIDFNYTV